MKFNGDNIFSGYLRLSSLVILLILIIILLTLVWDAREAILHNGFGFFTGTTWDPVRDEYGSLPFLAGTVFTAFAALLLCLPFSFAISILMGEYYRTGLFASIMNTTIELLAGIPSIVYGFWGLFVFVPFVRNIQISFGITPYGVGIFTAAVILCFMIIPYAASIAREVINMVPGDLKEAAYSLGATRLEVIRHIIIPHSISGIFAGILLALGRALGETMAVTMVIGNNNVFPSSFFAPANTMASLIANEFAEAVQNLHLSSLVQIGLLLFLVTTVINIIGKIVLNRLSYRE
jgi:phosphate transport system permease protein